MFCVMFQMSHVAYRMSCVRCHMSPFTCQNLVSIFFQKKKKNLIKKIKKSFFKKLDKEVELVGGGSVINGAYPVQFLSTKVTFRHFHLFRSASVFLLHKTQLGQDLKTLNTSKVNFGGTVMAKVCNKIRKNLRPPCGMQYCIPS